MIVFIKGLLIGVLMALPIGPSGAIAVRRALTQGPRAGFLAGIGASVADLIYLAILEYGTPWSLSLLDPRLIRGAGALVTIYIGTRLLLIKARPDCAARAESSSRSVFLSSFLVSIVNPAILISLAVLLSAFEVGEVNREQRSSVVLLAAVFCGSALLWFVLAKGLVYVRIVAMTRRIAGVVFIFLGIAVLVGTLSRLMGRP